MTEVFSPNVKISSKKYYLIFTGAFLLCVLLVYSMFLFNGKSFVFSDVDGGGDGLVQHYNAFVYYGKYLRSILRGILGGNGIQIPQWDLSIGYGQDIITTLSYYVIGDPFSFLSVFVPERMAEFAYSVLILVRLYAAGIAFSAYCRYRGYRSLFTIPGALIYLFSSYTIYIATLHPYFVLPMIYLPLLLLGIEKLMTEKKWILYILSLAIAGISNFYFFYMLCIFVFLYAVFRFFQLYAADKKYDIWKELFKQLVSFAIATLIGVMIAGILLIPNVMSLLGNSRVGVDVYVPALYPYSYYFKVFPAMLAGGFGSWYTFLGYSGIGVIAIILSFFSIRKNRDKRFLIIGFLMLLAFLLIPFAGHVMNGMSYVTNRWIWALAMMVGFMTVRSIPDLLSATRRQWIVISIVLAVFSAVILIFYFNRTEKNVLALLLYIFTTVLLYISVMQQSEKKLFLVTMFAVCAALFLNSFYLNSPSEEDYLPHYVDAGSAHETLIKDSPIRMLNKVEDPSFYRFDTVGIETGDLKRNSSMQYNKYGIAYYFSTTNPGVVLFNTDLYLNYPMDQSYNNLNARTELELITGVKYMIRGGDAKLPYSFKNKVAAGKEYKVYASDLSIPFGFTSDHFISSSTYNQLSPVEKQQALLQGIVVDSSHIPENQDLVLDEQQIPFTVVSQTGLEVIDDQTVEVTENNASLTLAFPSVSEAELYLQLDHFDYQEKNPYDLISKEELQKMSAYERNQMARDKDAWTPTTSTMLSLESGKSGTSIVYYTYKNNYYCNHHNFIGNLGYSKGERNKLTVRFLNVGTYHVDRVSLLSHRMDHVEGFVKHLTKDVLHHLRISGNNVDGDLNLEVPKLLCLQIPFSSGWEAQIDGQPANIQKADGMFMALEVPEGKHHITFSYETPYLKTGAFVSLAGVLLFALVIVCTLLFQRNQRIRSRAQQIWTKYKEYALYIIFGGATTVVNYIVYFVFTRLFGVTSVIVSNIIAWIAAVAFAYVTNRKWVFDSKVSGLKAVVKEIVRFVAGRLTSLGVETLILWIFVDLVGWNDIIVKVAASVITIILNYILSKFLIFKSR